MVANYPVQEVLQMREQGLTDNLISEELKKRRFSPQQISMAIAQADASSGMEISDNGGNSMDANSYGQNYGGYQQQPMAPQQMPAQEDNTDDNNLYERIEETVEGMIDEKWDELIGEVKKIVEWKEKMEDNLHKLSSDVDKLKEDFKLLHQGVLGKVDEYDNRMRDVDTELKAVSKVFKDVVPEFVENVKELKSITAKQKLK
jgi:hypothetical protein